MRNYIKSEFYRLFHSKMIYLFTFVLSLSGLLINILLCMMGSDSHFQYNTLSFSLSNLVANPMLFLFMAMLFTMLCYEGEQKLGTLKNPLAYGISFMKIFFGKTIVVTTGATLSMLTILSVYIGSALVLLKHSGPVSLMDIIIEVPAVFLLAVAAILSTIFFSSFFEKTSIVFICLLLFWGLIPSFLLNTGLGFRWKVLIEFANWLPQNFFSTEAIVNAQNSQTLWGTGAGFTKCMIAGIFWSVCFILLAFSYLREKDIG